MKGQPNNEMKQIGKRFCVVFERSLKLLDQSLRTCWTTVCPYTQFKSIQFYSIRVNSIQNRFPTDSDPILLSLTLPLSQFANSNATPKSEPLAVDS